MSGLMRKARRAVMGVSDAEATAFSRGDSPTWQHLKTAVRAAVAGYHTVLDSGRLTVLVPALERFPLELRGYAYEGAAMGLTGLDCFLPGKSRLTQYMNGPGAPHIFMVHIGAGEALARLRRRPEPFLLTRMADPVLRWLVMDGYGFHQGFFTPARYVGQQFVPGYLSPYARRVFDQGLGRSLWFTCGAQVPDIERTIAGFPLRRQPDLWLGVGVACTYVGGVCESAVEELRAAAGTNCAQLAVGSAFVAKGRHQAGNPLPDTNLACGVLCGGLSSLEAAALVDEAFDGLPARGPDPAYATLQAGLLSHFAPKLTPEA